MIRRIGMESLGNNGLITSSILLVLIYIVLAQ